MPTWTQVAEMQRVWCIASELARNEKSGAKAA